MSFPSHFYGRDEDEAPPELDYATAKRLIQLVKEQRESPAFAAMDDGTRGAVWIVDRLQHALDHSGEELDRLTAELLIGRVDDERGFGTFADMCAISTANWLSDHLQHVLDHPDTYF